MTAMEKKKESEIKKKAFFSTSDLPSPESVERLPEGPKPTSPFPGVKLFDDEDVVPDAPAVLYLCHIWLIFCVKKEEQSWRRILYYNYIPER